MHISQEGSYEDSLHNIESEFSGIAETIAGIRKVAKAIRGFSLPAFAEPKTWLLQEKDSTSVVAIDADLVAAWVGHMSHSSRLRMELLEDAVLRAIARSEFLVSATLTRAHMEAAGWAAYVNEVLVKIADSGSWEKLKKLIPKMLYGSAIAAEKHNLPPDAVFMPFVEPSSIMNAIDALDRFLSTVTGETGSSSRVLYALLCDYAHPTIGGVRHLFEPISESTESWIIQYSRHEKLNATDVQAILGALFRNMRLGHAAALLMCLGVLEETTTGLQYQKPSVRDGRGVWEHILLGDLPWV
jgi:hypothetical protein